MSPYRDPPLMRRPRFWISSDGQIAFNLDEILVVFYKPGGDGKQDRHVVWLRDREDPFTILKKDGLDLLQALSLPQEPGLNA